MLKDDTQNRGKQRLLVRDAMNGQSQVSKHASSGSFLHSSIDKKRKRQGIGYMKYSKFLDKRFVGTAASTVVKKVLLDQLLMTPILLVVFYTTMSILEGREHIFAELREKFARSFVANQVFWVPAQSANFALVPQHYRVAYVATASFIWINVLCWIKRSNVKKED